MVDIGDINEALESRLALRRMITNISDIKKSTSVRLLI